MQVVQEFLSVVQEREKCEEKKGFTESGKAMFWDEWKSVFISEAYRRTLDPRFCPKSVEKC
jgi:hypothetical protein